MFGEYAKYYDLINSKKPYKKEVQFVHEWAGKPQTILDVGCGTAKYWKYFPKSVTVAGIEKSKQMIDLAPEPSRILHADITDKNLCFGTPYFDCAIALFDVINYIPVHDWWWKLPIKKGGYFIFDIWDWCKVMEDGFKKTERTINGVTRTITPKRGFGNVTLDIKVVSKGKTIREEHKMFLWTLGDIVRFAERNGFDLNEIRRTDTWQSWFRLKKI